jgi:uncharacterized protein (DUF2141 family)
MRRPFQPIRRTAAAWAALAIAAVSGPSWAQAAADALVIDVRDLHSSKGQVLCFLYASAAGFPGDPARALAKTTAAIAEGTSVCRFAGLAPGAYAVAVVHDENGDGRLDRTALGMPAEGVGASNNPASHFGPPRFDQARFNYRGGAESLTVRVRYLR